MTTDAWRLVFLMTSAIYFIGNVFYVILIEGEPEPWNYPAKEKDSEDIEIKQRIQI